MREQWEVTTLGEVVSFRGGGTPSTEKAEFWNGEIPWVSPKDMKSSAISDSIDKITPEAIASSAASLIEKDAILIVVRSGILARTIPIAIVTRPLAVNQDIKALCPHDDVDPRYLHYFMQMAESTILKLVTRGATVHRISTDNLKSLVFPKPPLPEQQRIVVILDEAFARLATATANAKKNLENARELFDSQLQAAFDARHVQLPLRALATEITDGDHSPPPKTTSGVPFITISNIVRETRGIDFSTTFFVSKEYFGKLKKNKKPRTGDILYTVTGATLGIPVLVGGQTEFCFQRHIGLIRPKHDVDSRWLSYALASPHVFSQATNGSTGTAQKTVSLSVLRDIEVPKLEFSEQQVIGEKLDDLAELTRCLAAIYRQKIASLYSLKQIILQRAFSGELTASAMATEPPTVASTTNRELTAAVLAFAFERHRSARRDLSFGHVKAQKALHLVEAATALDLGRHPVKDAAGPNDFEHMLEAERWAEKQQFFKFDEIESGGYRFRPLERYTEGLASTHVALGPYKQQLQRVVDVLVPLDMVEAELLATVYAGWNNLILEGRATSNEDIVTASREEWHDAKKNIPRHRFFAAINALKSAGLVPDGSAKRVVEKYLI